MVPRRDERGENKGGREERKERAKTGWKYKKEEAFRYVDFFVIYSSDSQAERDEGGSGSPPKLYKRRKKSLFDIS